MESKETTNRWLERILIAKRRDLDRDRLLIPLSELEKRIKPAQAGRFRQALEKARSEQQKAVIISELKSASPSRGIICRNYDPVRIAQSYQKAGAAALSILTNQEFFSGSLDHLKMVRSVTSLPLLRKDFTISEYHLYEAVAAGADAILLIVAAISPTELSRLLIQSHQLGLDALVEVHSAEELKIAIDAGSDMIGVNNRDLTTFEVSLDTSLKLIADIPDSTLAISESGIKTANDLVRLHNAGFDAFLIGERFMDQPDPGYALAQFLSSLPNRQIAASGQSL
ncbi:MAG: hypothetical protein A3F68_12900 [Acidobacteria bacterium RIFCSPLOWO2_12_FULL_54_10]|nr:MAG: hypothetical protein A3F68_12900 [Acidobacteria bacterium RIFCSPLOWO2_12_FULL_54_10]